MRFVLDDAIRRSWKDEQVSHPAVPLPGFESDMAYVKPAAVVEEIMTCLDDFSFI